MNKFLGAAALIIISATLASAAEKPADFNRYYAGMRVANSSLRLSTKYRDFWGDSAYDTRRLHPIGFGMLVGYRFNESMRMDVEIDYMAAKARSGADRLSMNSNFVNFYYNLYNNRIVTPYIGLGMGIANVVVDSDSRGKAQSWFNFASQFATGLEFVLNDYLSMDLGARYRRFGSAKHENGDWTDVSAWQFYAGMNYKF